jgi:hypothetical protein
MIPSTLLADPQPAPQTITLAFLACGCRTVYDRADRNVGDVVVCPNLYTCDDHDKGWTSITETLAGSLPGVVRTGAA